MPIFMDLLELLKNRRKVWTVFFFNSRAVGETRSGRFTIKSTGTRVIHKMHRLRIHSIYDITEKQTINAIEFQLNKTKHYNIENNRDLFFLNKNDTNITSYNLSYGIKRGNQVHMKLGGRKTA